MNSKIKYALAIILAGFSAHLWAACDVQSNSSIVATANGDSCTNSSAISTSTASAFGIDAGSGLKFLPHLIDDGIFNF